jgi:hypothetical protein
MVEPAYMYLNTSLPEDLAISSSTEIFLKDYYKEEAHSLEELIGRRVPWKT